MIDKFDGRYRFLSNFYPCEIDYQGITYPSNEHFYVAMKINGAQIINGRQLTITDSREYVSSIKSPGFVKKFGRNLNVRKDWDEVKLKVMEYGVNQKFTKHKNLGELLLSTGSEELIESNWWHDTFWGVCNGVGENHLGKILMKVRDELRKKETFDRV